MRMVLIMSALAAAAALTPPRPALAYEGPWCAVVDQGGGGVEERCSMQSFEMCRAEARLWGPTGFCRQNPRFPGYWAPPRQRAKSQRRS